MKVKELFEKLEQYNALREKFEQVNSSFKITTQAPHTEFHCEDLEQFISEIVYFFHIELAQHEITKEQVAESVENAVIKFHNGIGTTTIMNKRLSFWRID